MVNTRLMKESDTSWKESILKTLPDNLQKTMRGMPASVERDLEEIRIRETRPLMVYSHGRDYFLSKDGSICTNVASAYHITRYDTKRILDLISEYSIYAFDEEMRSGYITLKGGHRIGMVGKAVLEDGRVKTLKYINSFNIRISREVIGAADKVLPYIIKDSKVCHTLILSPPQMGKTTMLRDIARQLSDGFYGFKGIKVGVVDERSEIAGCYEGVPQKKIGIQTDVLDGCPKATGIIMLIRSMSPAVIITDEIGKIEDVSAVEDALNAGIKIITTAHGFNLTDAQKRPILSELLKKSIFERIIILGNTKGVGTLESIYSGDGIKPLLDKPLR